MHSLATLLGTPVLNNILILIFNILPPSYDVNGVDKVLQTPFNIVQYNTTTYCDLNNKPRLPK